MSDDPEANLPSALEIVDMPVVLSEESEVIDVDIDVVEKKEQEILPEPAVVPSSTNMYKALLSSTNFPASFYYPADHQDLVRLSRPQELNADFLQLHRSFGFDAAKRNSLHVIDDQFLLFVVGNTVQSIDMTNGNQNVLFGFNSSLNAAVSCVCVHPSQRYFAVAEAGDRPNIYVYSWPEMRVIRILRGGAELSYGAICFSPCGTRLGSVSGDPDYSLIVWEWAEERVLLRLKAFSQVVNVLSFSAQQPGVMYTAGQAHVKFWSLAETFTGLKLQGFLGKFGRIDICDICAVLEDNGVVLTGTEHGQLLMWDRSTHVVRAEQYRSYGKGQMVDGYIVDEHGQVFVAPGDKPPASAVSVVYSSARLEDGIILGSCHQGEIISISVQDSILTTFGRDGVLRRWEWEDASAKEGVVALQCLGEIDAQITARSAVLSGGNWVVAGVSGQVVLLEPTGNRRVLLSTHAGAVVSANSARGDVVVSAGGCGTVRVWDVIQGHQVYARKVSDVGVSFIKQFDIQGEERFVIGHTDGTIRVLALGTNGIHIISICKPHTCKITNLTVSSDSKYILTAAVDSSLFITEISSQGTVLQPLYLIQLPLLQQFATARMGEKLLTKDEAFTDSSKVKGDGISSGVAGPLSLCFGWDEKSVFFGYGQYLVELYLPSQVSGDLSSVPSSDERDTYLTVCPMRLHDVSTTLSVRRSRTTEEKEALLLEGADLTDHDMMEELIADPRSDIVSVVHRNVYYNEQGHALYNHGIPNLLVGFVSGNSNLSALLPSNSTVSETKRLEKYRTLYNLGGSGSHLQLGTWFYGFTAILLQEAQGIMVFGSQNGTVELRDSFDSAYYLCGHQDASSVLGLCSNLQWISVTTAQGGIWMLKHALSSALQEADRTYTVNLYTSLNQVIQSERERAKHLQGIELRNERMQTQVGVFIPLTSSFIENAWKGASEGILDIGAVSLVLSAEEAKQRHEHDELASIASKKRLLLLSEMKALVEDYDALRDKAASVGVHINGMDIDAESHAALRAQSEAQSTRLETALRSDVQREVAACEAFVESVSRTMELESLTVCALGSDLHVSAPHVTKLVVKPCPACQSNPSSNATGIAVGVDPEPPVQIGTSTLTVAEEEKSFQNDQSAVLTSATGAAVEKRHALLTQRKEFIQKIHTAMNEEQPELPPMDTTVGLYRLKAEEDETKTAPSVAANASNASRLGSIEGTLDLVIGASCTCMEQQLRDKVYELERSVWDRVCALRQVKYSMLQEMCHRIFRITEINHHVGVVSIDSITDLSSIRASNNTNSTQTISEVERLKTFEWVKNRKTGVDGFINALGHCLTRKEAQMLLNQMVSLREWPESKYIVTDAEITAFSTRIREDVLRSKLRSNTHSGGFEGDDFGIDEPSTTTTQQAPLSNSIQSESTANLWDANDGPAGSVVNVNHDNITETAMAVEWIMNLWEQRDLHNERLALLPSNLLDEHEYILEVLTLREEREELLEGIKESVLSFDSAVEQLRLEKMKIMRDITAHRCTLLHCAEEQSVKAAYVKLERNLYARMVKCVKGVTAITNEISACQGSIEELHTLITQGEAGRESTLREFNTLIQQFIDTYKQPEDSEGSGTVLNVTEIYPLLLRYFLMNDTVGANGGGKLSLNSNGGNNDNDEERDSDGDEDDEDSNSMSMLTSVCDATLLESVQVLRAHRQKIENDMVAKEQSVAELNKTLQRLTMRSRAVERDAATITDEAREVSKDKRHAVFRVTTTVPMRLSQIHVSDGASLQDSVVIGTDTISVLKNRVFILEQYARTLQERISGYRREGRGYVKEVEAKKKKLLEEETHCKDVQLLKFGQLIEQDVLGKVGVDDESQSLRHKLRWMEDISDRKAREWQAKVRLAKDELLKATEENTALLEKVSKLTALQCEIERELNSQTKNLHLKQGGDVGVADGDNESKQHEQELIHKIQTQEKEIDALRSELAALKMKKGRMYAPIPQQ